MQILGHTLKKRLLIMHGWPCLSNQALRVPPHLPPRYLELELSRHVLHNIAHFRLHAHSLRAETGR